MTQLTEEREFPLPTIRARIVAFLERRDTALMEFALSMSAFINAFQVTSFDKGQPMAPFLYSALSWLSAGGFIWWLSLLFYAVASLLALVSGLATGNHCRLRGILSLFGCLLWTVVAVAICTSSAHPLTGARYALAALCSYGVALILWIRHDVACKRHAISRKRENEAQRQHFVEKRLPLAQGRDAAFSRYVGGRHVR
jgi:hypothetical protein